MSESESEAEPLTCVSLEAHICCAGCAPTGPEVSVGINPVGICRHKLKQMGVGVRKKRKAGP